MKVLKFGGTSVGTAERMKHVAELINDDQPKIVVLSAMSGTTNSLVKLCSAFEALSKEDALQQIDELEKKYLEVNTELFSAEDLRAKGKAYIQSVFSELRMIAQSPFVQKTEKIILAKGELLSTHLFQYYLEEQGVNAVLLDAFDFMRITSDDEPDLSLISEKLNRQLERHLDVNLFITQGYICLNHLEEIDNLKRGGSDYSASLIGAAVQAEEIQIWTDISGLHNNDPRFVKDTYPIKRISFDEAAELAYFGAKILHPASILPAKAANIPVALKNTMKPEDFGTRISNESTTDSVKSIAAKDGITAIKIKSARMLLAYGFLRKIFEVFEEYRTPIDMITTSEVAVSLTIDDTDYLSEIITKLEEFGMVETDQNQSIICIVGDFTAGRKGAVLNVLEALKDIPIRMISYGGSKHNISLLVNADDKVKALQLLNTSLFKERALA